MRRCAYVLLQLEDLIASGRVHPVPDPMDIDESYRQEMFAMVNDARDFQLSEDDRRLVKNLSRDDFLRWVRRMAVPDLRNYLTFIGPASVASQYSISVPAVTSRQRRVRMKPLSSVGITGAKVSGGKRGRAWARPIFSRL